jgi:hypothetical protein
MTLVPPDESGNTSVKSLDDRRIYELWPTATEVKSATITDFEGRTLSRRANSLEINGDAGRITLRWRFDPVTAVTLGDMPLEVHTMAGPCALFGWICDGRSAPVRRARFIRRGDVGVGVGLRGHSSSEEMANSFECLAEFCAWGELHEDTPSLTNVITSKSRRLRRI